MNLPFKNFKGAQVQKIFALDTAGVILSLYSAKVDRIHVVLSIKKNGVSFESLTAKPQSSPSPNSFLQLARKHLLNQKINSIYSNVAHDIFIVEFADFFSDNIQDQARPCLILDGGTKP